MDENRSDSLFAGLVLMFQAAALQHLGKVKDPVSGTIERNLEQAQAIIDLLDMLAVKTKGNLNSEQSTLLSRVAQDLKLNYVDEAAKDQAARGVS